MTKSIFVKLTDMVREAQASSSGSELVILCPTGTLDKLSDEIGASVKDGALKRGLLQSILTEEYKRFVIEPTSGMLLDIPIVEVHGVTHFAVVDLDAMSVIAVKERADCDASDCIADVSRSDGELPINRFKYTGSITLDGSQFPFEGCTGDDHSQKVSQED